MAIVKVKFDNQLKQSDIIIPLTNSSIDEAGDAYVRNQPEKQQTLVYGIQSPLIMVNNIVVDFSDVINFELKCVKDTPSIDLTIKDRYQLISMIDSPGIDNELRVQILPKFDNIYKKINLTFYITNSQIRGNYITISGIYKVPKFTSDNIKSFGEINTYQLFEKIAIDSQLGFATNVESNDIDKRYIYCDNKSYKDLLFSEIKKSGADLQIYDYWVDWWNNIVLVDLYERYNTIDKDKDLQIWIAGPNEETTEGIEIKPQQVVATLNNHYSIKFSELYIQECNKINKPGQQVYSGTDRVYSVYEEDKNEYLDYLIQDGDAKKDIFTKFEYLGENYGSFNYLLAGKKRDTFLQKINSNETIEVILNTPLLGLMRGNKVNVLWYYNNSYVNEVRQGFDTIGVTNKQELNISIPNDGELETKSQDGEMILDKSVSGQYLIVGCKIKYYNNKWQYVLTLSRPTDSKTKLLKDE